MVSSFRGIYKIKILVLPQSRKYTKVVKLLLQYLEYLKTPAWLIIGILVLLVVANVIGTILDLKGKVVPEYMNIRGYIRRKKAEKNALQSLPDVISKIQDLDITQLQSTIQEFNSHYNTDNINKRDSWMTTVNQHMHNSEPILNEIKAELLEIKIENMRSAILDFAAKVINIDYPATREQFNKIFKQHARYEEIIEQNKLTNGEVDIAYQIIKEAYQSRLRVSSFVEDIRGYNIK